mgnify:CR=1 FL=1
MSNTELAFSIRLAAWGRRVRRLLRGIAATTLVAGCTVQLTAPYSSDIDDQASALQSDFLRFAAGMQMVAGTPKGYYDEHASQYADFEARLAVIRMRSESLSGGVPCGRALDAAPSLLRAARRRRVTGAESAAGRSGASRTSARARSM